MVSSPRKSSIIAQKMSLEEWPKGAFCSNLVQFILKKYFERETVEHRWRNINERLQIKKDKMRWWHYGFFRRHTRLTKTYGQYNITAVSGLHAFDMNANKTKVMIVSKQQIRSDVHILVNKLRIQGVTQCQYLGTTMSDGWDNSQEIKCRNYKARDVKTPLVQFSKVAVWPLLLKQAS